MLSDEEKKAIELLGDYLYFGHKEGVLCKNLRTIYAIIEKQSKEIEELKKYKKYYEEMEEVNKKFIAVEEIKAKIEEIDEVLKGQLIEKIRVYFEAQKEVLQSLLEKE